MSLPSNFIAITLIAIALITAARLLWKRPRRWPWRLLLQSLALPLVYLVLNPPPQPLPQAGTLTVLGAGWRDALTHRVGPGPPELHARLGENSGEARVPDSRDLNDAAATTRSQAASADIEANGTADGRRGAEATVGQGRPYATSRPAEDALDGSAERRAFNASAELGPPAAIIALPEAENPLPPGVQRAPDLATALRLRPGFAALRLFGRGLSLRDLDVARQRELMFFPAPLPHGFVAIGHDPEVMLGAAIHVTAHWHGPAPARVQLLDAAGETLAEQVFDAVALPASSITSGASTAAAERTSATGAAIEEAGMADPSSAAALVGAATGSDAARVAPAARPEIQGGPSGSTQALTPADAAASLRSAPARAPTHSGIVHLQTSAHATGALSLRMRALDANDQTLDEYAWHLDVAPPRAVKALLLAAAPGPETRALRRWAVDAGLDFDSRIQFAPGLVQGGRSLAPSTEELSTLDLLILEERAWTALGAGGRAAVLGAMENGLGLLLRLTALPNPGVLAELREAGFDLQRIPGQSTAQTTLATAPTRLRQLPIRVQAKQAVTAVHSASGAPLAAWRARGLGRFGLVWLTDSYRLQASGESQAYAELWSALATAVARAPAPSRPAPAPALRLPHGQQHAWAGERITLCGAGDPLSLWTPEGARLSLASPDTRGCAAALPRTAGMYRAGEGRGELGDADDEDAGFTSTGFEVRSPAGHAALHAADLYARTRALASARPAMVRASAPSAVAGDHRLWLLALLTVLGLLWWLERPRSA